MKEMSYTKEEMSYTKEKMSYMEDEPSRCLLVEDSSSKSHAHHTFGIHLS
jgi:hypothetical protein